MEREKKNDECVSAQWCARVLPVLQEKKRVMGKESPATTPPLAFQLSLQLATLSEIGKTKKSESNSQWRYI